MSENKALFLDRDGVINIDHGYVYKKEEFEFVDGIYDVCLKAQENGFKLIIVTNQAGIGRGYYTQQDFDALMRWVCDEFKNKGIAIDGIYNCPDHPEKGLGSYKKFSIDRKPGPGMFLKARLDHGINLSQSFLIGDSFTDIYAGLAAGLKACIYVGEKFESASPNVFCVENLEEARKLLDEKI